MHKKSRLGLAGATTAVLAIAIAAVGPVSARSPELASRVRFMPVKGAAAQTPAGEAHSGPRPGGGGTQAGIYYHGGRIVAQDFKVESIYWSTGQTYPNGPDAGTSDTNVGDGTSDHSLVGAFLRGLGGSSYYNINKTYWDNLGASGTLRYETGGLNYVGYWADGTNAPSGTQSVDDAAIQAEIVSGFTSGRIAYQQDTIYAVFSAGGVNLGGGAFSQYCAYHGNFSYGGNDVIYAVMPYNAYSSGCKAQSTTPNGDPADYEVNTLAHEIEEANSDPDLSAWWDNRGYENADKCAWTFGTTSTAANGSKYNMVIGGYEWLVQRNWKNNGRGSCALS
jgi:hypothetical protein